MNPEKKKYLYIGTGLFLIIVIIIAIVLCIVYIPTSNESTSLLPQSPEEESESEYPVNQTFNPPVPPTVAPTVPPTDPRSNESNLFPPDVPGKFCIQWKNSDKKDITIWLDDQPFCKKDRSDGPCRQGTTNIESDGWANNLGKFYLLEQINGSWIE